MEVKGMKQVKFTKSEVISYIETLINDGTANEEHEELYIKYMWSGKLIKNDTYKSILREMKKLWNESY
jgi:hypothetical protein